jgi:hypothetical protein
MTKRAGSGSISQSHASADPDLDPDPHQNVMDPQHWFLLPGVVCNITLKYAVVAFNLNIMRCLNIRHFCFIYNYKF